jgi:hypothetical protein
VRSFRSDHYPRWTAAPGRPTPPVLWPIACETSTIRLGTMMTSATFRYPGPLATWWHSRPDEHRRVELASA